MRKRRLQAAGQRQQSSPTLQVQHKQHELKWTAYDDEIVHVYIYSSSNRTHQTIP
jgi:hypothetical protein